MPVWLLMVSIIVVSMAGNPLATNPLAAEPLDLRFGPDRERGYRSFREYERTDQGLGNQGFRNRDRANFLGNRSRPEPEPVAPRVDLQSPAKIGLQR